jgi:hypothetical protein
MRKKKKKKEGKRNLLEEQKSTNFGATPVQTKQHGRLPFLLPSSVRKQKKTKKRKTKQNKTREQQHQNKRPTAFYLVTFGNLPMNSRSVILLFPKYSSLAALRSISLKAETLAKNIYQKEGVRGFYKGLGSALATQPTFWTMYFPTYKFTISDDEEPSPSQ